jgi:CRISPR-associated endonuclease Cas2
MVVISYDICNNKRLIKVAKYLEKNGVRVQKSIFELDMSIRKANTVFNGIKELIEEEEGDKCFMFNILNKEDIQSKTSIERIF